MSDATLDDRLERRSTVGLWLALLAGPSAASVQLSVNYALIKWACAHGGGWVLTTIAATLLAVSVGGATLGLVHLVNVDDGQPAAQAWSAGSRRILAATAVGLNALIAIFLINTLIALAALTPCE